MTAATEIVHTSREESLRKTAMFDYVLHLVGILFSLGTLNVLALVINYARRPSARGTIYESHFTWMIRSVWWGLFWVIVIAIPALILTALTFGLLSFLFLLPAVWFLYRMIRGLLALNDRRPMPV